MMMFWLYLLVTFVILCGAAVAINRRRRRGIAYDHQSAAQLDHAQGADTMKEFPGSGG
jgi:hypothetical protein